jgi:nucleoside-diphosphate-sugar epimerase
MCKHALIVGSSGIVGHPLAQRLLLQPEWKVTGIARRGYEHKPEGLNLITCDITSREDCENSLGNLNDITHVFYVIWVNTKDDETNCSVNRKIIQNILSVVQKASPGLVYFYLQTGTKHYGNWVGPEKGQITPAREDLPRLKAPMFYYDLEDVLFSENKGKSWTYNIARPATIVGWSARTQMNLGVTLAVYATILKETGQPLIFPYSEKAYNATREFTDSQLLCDFILWMTPELKQKKLVANEAFNLVNGDYLRMKQLWPKIAEYFGMEAKLADTPTSVQELMKDKDEVWDRIVAKHQLKKYRLEDLGTWEFMHQTLSREFDELTLVQKAVAAGFKAQRKTDVLFENFFDGLKSLKVIPETQERQVSSQ